MWNCKHCKVDVSRQIAHPAIDSLGIHFVCPSCFKRNSLVGAGRGSVRLQQATAADDSSVNRPFLRSNGDLFFRQKIHNKYFQIQLTRDCLDRVFGSDGSVSQDTEVLRVNLKHIIGIAAQKLRDGSHSPIKVLCADFGLA
ncbi:hypothetical protein [Caballeronia sp. INDeC2]|uniref:hypothetical protein n=1 Tax=Caballeronia sp. INDeC2 TaxID=2921747 RepID=UPI002027F162|nr:hypothetical protein [Caballeronia sp. INDeC2]